MVLLRKGFYLELDTAKAAESPKLQLGTVRVVSESPEVSDSKDSASAVLTAAASSVAAAPVPGRAQTTSTSTEPKPSLTTAEAIAAELAAAEASRPAIQYVTFAPEALQPGTGIRPGKRKPGRNLSNFRSMASEMFKS
jgi:hypothetical protein